MNKITGLYPGSFDPITNGHIDIILRASKVVDILIIGVAENEKKKHLFSLKDRRSLIEEQLDKKKSRINNVNVVMFDGLLMSFAEKVNAKLSNKFNLK